MNWKSSTSRKALSVDHGQSGPLGGCFLRWGGCFLRCFFGIFFLAGAVAFYFLTIRPLWDVYAAGSWTETPCTILSSEVETHDGDDGDTYSIEITYEYTSDGQQHTSDRYHFMGGASSGRAGKAEVVKAHPPGFQTVCYVNPDDPEDAVIERGLTADMWWGLFPLPFLAVGLGGLIFAPRLTNKGRSESADSTDQTFPADGSQDQSSLDDSLVDGDDGPLTLEPETSPAVMFGCALFVALFWNGITSVFVYQAYLSHQRGKPEWGLTLFIIPFVLVGLAIIVGVIYSFLAMFNPRPTLTLSRGRLPLGSTAKVSWRFSGNASKLQNLTITLKGVEKATYRRGTDTHTDEESFCEQVIFDSPQSYEFASGETEFTIPTDSMHTFEAGNNEIVWSLHVAGDVPMWPDVNATFPISVTPHEPTAH